VNEITEFKNTDSRQNPSNRYADAVDTRTHNVTTMSPAKKAEHFFITEINRLMLFEKIIPVYTESHITDKNKMHELLI